MEKINYLEIFKEAWHIAWNRKYLWWLGLFVGSGGGMSFSLPSDFQKKAGDNPWSNNIASFAEAHLSLIIGVLAIIFVLAIILGILKILSFGGLIRAFLDIEKQKTKTFRESLREGKLFFWRILGIRALLFFSVLALLVVLSLPVIFLFLMKSFILGGLATLLAILILVPALISLSFISRYSNLYVVTSDLSVRDALEQGSKIFSKNIWSGIIMAFLFFPIGIAAGIALIVPAAIIVAAGFALGYILDLAFSAIGIWIATIIAGLLLLGLILLFRSVLGVFYNAAWFLFFQSIAKVKKEEVVITEELAIDKVIQPEKA